MSAMALNPRKGSPQVHTGMAYVAAKEKTPAKAAEACFKERL